jgi:hypothetical protein
VASAGRASRRLTRAISATLLGIRRSISSNCATRFCSSKEPRKPYDQRGSMTCLNLAKVLPPVSKMRENEGPTISTLPVG